MKKWGLYGIVRVQPDARKGTWYSLIRPGLLTDQPFIGIYIELVNLILWRDVFDVVCQ